MTTVHLTSRAAAGRGRVWRSVAGVALAASMSVGGAQVVRADEPILATAPPPVTEVPVTDTAAPPVVESSSPEEGTVGEPVVAVGLPPVPPAVTTPSTPSTVIVAVGLPPVPVRPVDTGRDGEPTPEVDATDVGGAVAGTLVAAALAGWRGA